MCVCERRVQALSFFIGVNRLLLFSIAISIPFAVELVYFDNCVATASTDTLRMFFLSQPVNCANKRITTLGQFHV